MKNKVIDVLDEMIEEYSHIMYLAFCGNTSILIDKEAKAKLIEAKSRIQSLPDDDWIAVTDSLPYEGEDCILYGLKSKSTYLGSIKTKEDETKMWNLKNFFDYVSLDTFTHWKYLPTPPLPLPPNKL